MPISDLTRVVYLQTVGMVEETPTRQSRVVERLGGNEVPVQVPNTGTKTMTSGPEKLPVQLDTDKIG